MPKSWVEGEESGKVYRAQGGTGEPVLRREGESSLAGVAVPVRRDKDAL